MVDRMISHAARLEHRPALGRLGWLRGTLGAAIGIGIAGLISWLVLPDHGGGLPLMVAPLGASAVLVFAIPASPLAQPWPVIAGDLISAAIGLVVGHVVGAPVLAAALAVGLSIAAMSLTRSLHPPGGACALLYAVGAAGPQAWGLAYWLCIAANVLSLAMVGWAWNTATGHPWPHRIAPPDLPTAAEPPTEPEMIPASPLHAAIEATLADWDEVIDADVDDLAALFEAVTEKLALHPRPTA